MRPKSIRNFDFLYLGGIALSLVTFLLTYDDMVAEIQRQTAESGLQVGGGAALGGFLFGTVISIAIWFLISRLRIEVVKWVLVVFFLFGLIGLPVVLANVLTLSGLLNLAIFVVQALAIWMLFQPDARAWFAEKRGGGDL